VSTSHFFSQIVPILALVAILFWGRRELRRRRWSVSQLEHELLSRFPVYSAETTRGTEAEFIRERLPRKFPRPLVLLLALGVFAAVAWWLTS